MPGKRGTESGQAGDLRPAKRGDEREKVCPGAGEWGKMFPQFPKIGNFRMRFVNCDELSSKKRRNALAFCAIFHYNETISGVRRKCAWGN